MMTIRHNNASVGFGLWRGSHFYEGIKERLALFTQ